MLIAAADAPLPFLSFLPLISLLIFQPACCRCRCFSTLDTLRYAAACCFAADIFAAAAAFLPC